MVLNDLLGALIKPGLQQISLAGLAQTLLQPDSLQGLREHSEHVELVHGYMGIGQVLLGKLNEA